MYSDDKYIFEEKLKLDKNFLSPLFIRYANLLYMNELYEECISVCKTGLEIYPNYLTAKLMLLKAFLKAEYLNEAENLFKEIKYKITNKDLLVKFENNIHSLKTISGQEKIYYTKESKSKVDFKTFEKQFHLQENLFSDITLKNLFDEDSGLSLLNENDFTDFRAHFNSFHFEKRIKRQYNQTSGNIKPSVNSETIDILSRIKIVTETLADIYADQGNYKEAFEAYKILIRGGSKNKKRIEDKLYELERNMLRDDNI